MNEQGESDAVRTGRILLRLFNALIGAIYGTAAALIAVQLIGAHWFTNAICGMLLGKAIVHWWGLYK